MRWLFANSGHLLVLRECTEIGSQLLPRSTPLGLALTLAYKCQEGGGAQEKTETKGVLDGRRGQLCSSACVAWCLIMTAGKQSHASCSRSHARCSFRSFTEQASLRSYIDALHIDEKALAGAVKPLLKAQDGDFRAKLSRGVPHNEALLESSRAFNEQMQQLCFQAVLERDRRAVTLADERGTPALEALRRGALDPPWRRWTRGEERTVVRELAQNLDETRPNREYVLRSRIVRTETSDNYSSSRLRPPETSPCLRWSMC